MKKETNPKLIADNEPNHDRKNETHDDAVKRYLDHPKDETREERARRINRFRSGY